ncbi:MAG TPA: DUF4389 domain-containing protein [Gammaproteobacteria bacterium]|nr:DUF4389 domain-containing protein [Gammaproteobacteria bacterium]
MSNFDPKHILNIDNWVRLGFTALFYVIFMYSYLLLCVLILASFATLLLSGKPNEQVRDFGNSLSSYIYQICLFVTYNSDVKPFPFDKWPKE